MHKIFVFGTLKEGFPNFHRNKGTKESEIYTTKECFSLFLVGERHSPWMVPESKTGLQVKGEVYKLDDKALAEMDLLEKTHQPDGYYREEIPVISETGDEHKVFAYLKTNEQLMGADVRQKLKDEYLLEHSLHYRSRSK